MFDWEPRISLHAMQGNRVSTLTDGEVSWVFSSCDRNLGYILELQHGCAFETGVFSAKSGQLYRHDRHHRNVNYAWQDKKNSSVSQAGDQASFSSCHRNIGLPINFQEESGIINF